MLDDAGTVCHENDGASGLAKDEKRELVFDTKSPCQPTGILFEAGGRYLITIKAREPVWHDGDIPTTSAGFSALDAPRLDQKLLMLAAVPMRRELTRPWFRIVARTGGKGGEESYLDPDPKDHSIEDVLRATRDGELFLFVNDAVIGVPGWTDRFYRNNQGTADVTVVRR